MLPSARTQTCQPAGPAGRREDVGLLFSWKLRLSPERGAAAPGRDGGHNPEKDADTGEVTIQDYSLVPLVMHYEKDQTNARVYLLDDYTEELAAAHGVHDYSSDEFTLESIRQYFSTYTDTEGESTS